MRKNIRIIIAAVLIIGLALPHSGEVAFADEVKAVETILEEVSEEKEIPAPYGCKIESIDEKGITFYWKRPDVLSGYQVYRSYTKNGKYKKIATLSGSDHFRYTDSEFNRSKDKVYYKVRGYLTSNGGRIYSPFSSIKRADIISEPKITMKSLYLRSGSTRQLRCLYGWGNIIEADWSVDLPEVVSVDEDGLVTALAEGKAVVTCIPRYYIKEAILDDTTQSVVSGEAIKGVISDSAIGTAVSGEAIKGVISDSAIGTAVSGEAIKGLISDSSIGTAVSGEAIKGVISDSSIGTAVSGEAIKGIVSDSSIGLLVTGPVLTCTVTVDRKRDYVPGEFEQKYQLDEDGVWRSKVNTSTSSAVIMLVGDVMCTGAQMKMVKDEENYDFSPSFSFIKDIISSADLSVANFETVISSAWPTMQEEAYIDGKPNCNAPEQFLYAVAEAGFDGVTVANNHCCDAGMEGILDTLDELDKANLANTGMFRDSEQDRYMIFEVNGIKVGFIAYNSSTYNGKDDGWSNEDRATHLNYYKHEKAVNDIKKLKLAGAEYIIAAMHWGTKNVAKVRKSMREIASELAELGVDYIAGAHSHLLQEYDVITTSSGKKVPVMYSMGDFVSSINQIEGNRDSLILRLEIERQSDGSIALASDSYIPCVIETLFEDKDYVTIPLDSDLNGGVKFTNSKSIRDRIKRSVGDLLSIYSEESINLLVPTYVEEEELIESDGEETSESSMITDENILES